MAIYKEEKSYTEEDLLLFIHKIRSENWELKKKIDEATEILKKCTEKEINYITYKNKKHCICSSDVGQLVLILEDILIGGVRDAKDKR